MNIADIPKFFWYSLSLCMLIATVGFVYIGYKSSLVSIEIYNAKISLSSALDTAQDIKIHLEDEIEKLNKANIELESKLEGNAEGGDDNKPENNSKSERKKGNVSKSSSGDKSSPAVNFQVAPGDTVWGIARKFDLLDKKIQKAEKSIQGITK